MAAKRWVDEPHTAKGYQSDYDLLIIVNDKRLTDRVTYWAKLEARLYAEQTITKAIRTPINFIIQTLKEVNAGLAHGRYFFRDVARDGIALYESDDTELHQPKPKTPAQALAIAQEYFNEEMPSASGMLETARFSANQGRLADCQEGDWSSEGISQAVKLTGEATPRAAKSASMNPPFPPASAGSSPRNSSAHI